jgi:hypothetical protein
MVLRDVDAVLGDFAAVLRRIIELLVGSDPRWFRQELADASRELGVRLRPVGPFATSAEGICEGFAVRVRTTVLPAHDNSETPNEPHLIINAMVSGGGIPGWLTLAPKGETADEVLTGDSLFDDAVAVRGETSVVLALLTPDLRRRLALLVALGGRLEEGRLSSRTTALVVTRGVVHRALQSLLALARDLASSEGGGLCERLLRNARTDLHAGVRLANLAVLQERFASTPEAWKASRDGLEDANPWVRLSSARFLGDEGHGVLEALVHDRSVPGEAAAEAVALLAARLLPERAGPLLIEVVKTRTDDGRREAVGALGRLRYLPALGPLAVLLERADPATACAAAASLAMLGDAKAEPALLEVIAGEERDVRLAAVRALATVGSVRAVEPLIRLAETVDAETRQDVRDAIRAIQSRLHGAESGQLSLAASDGQSGWLSEPQPGAGAGDLSLAPDTEETKR